MRDSNPSFCLENTNFNDLVWSTQKHKRRAFVGISVVLVYRFSNSLKMLCKSVILKGILRTNLLFVVAFLPSLAPNFQDNEFEIDWSNSFFKC